MNEELQLEIVELGDAKKETKGLPTPAEFEQNSTFSYRQPD